MKEPTREEWAEDFLGKAHDELNAAAVKGELSNDANEARLLIGQALTLARKPAGRGVLGRWPEAAIAKVKEAQALLRTAKWTPEADRAMYFCDDAVRLIEAGGKLRPEFTSRAEDREVPALFFGNAKVANDAKGQGVPLNRPLASSDAGAGREVEAAVDESRASRLRAKTQSRQLEETGEQGREHTAQELALQDTLAQHYGPGRKAAQARLTAIRARRASGGFWYRLTRAQADKSQAAALEKNLADIAGREREQRERLAARQESERRALAQRHEHERQADEHVLNARPLGRRGRPSGGGDVDAGPRQSWRRKKGRGLGH